MDKKLYIFDLDGTLVDAYGAIARSFNATMRRLGYPAQPLGVIKRAVGWGDINLLRPFVRPADLPRAIALYRKHHARSLTERVRWLPYARGLLARLKKEGCLLAIASNRPTKFTHLILKAVKADGLFDRVLCADRVKKGKPHPLILNLIMRSLKIPRAQTVFVGDMVIDVQAGRRAGVTTIAVATGSSSARELRLAKPDLLIPSLRCARLSLAPLCEA